MKKPVEAEVTLDNFVEGRTITPFGSSPAIDNSINFKYLTSYYAY